MRASQNGRGRQRLSSPFSRTAQIRRLVYRGEAAFRRGSYTEAEASCRAALRRLGYPEGPQAGVVSDPDLLVSSLELVACVRRELTDFAEAVLLHQQALTVLGGPAAMPSNDRLTLVLL